MILDGFGFGEPTETNAIHKAKTPHLDWLFEKFPYEKISASGLDVGLPAGQMGNSEVGHVNIGAGRVVYQELTRISKEIDDGVFFENPALVASIENAKKLGTKLHIYGLVSDGGVHSHNTHLYALLKLAKDCGLQRVYVHAYLDGRDTPPASGLGYVRELEAEMSKIGVGHVASVHGRYYAMDRDKRYERVEVSYKALTQGEGVVASSASAGIEASYANGVNDEFVVPFVVHEDGKPVCIEDNDSIIFFNFRPDRAREITRAFLDADFSGFSRAVHPKTHYTGFTQYDATIVGMHVAFHAQSMENVLGEYLGKLGKTQLRLAETEKYAHVTFFTNGGREEPYPNEDRILVPSPKVATYDLQPTMSAPEVADKLCEAIESEKYDVIIINFANCDMVGHTGVFDAAVAAVECVDSCVAKAISAIDKVNARLLLCADHGNAEKMFEDGQPFTAHTLNPVPLLLYNCPGMKLTSGGRLCDIAPTLLDVMGIEIPQEMEGRSLLVIAD